MARVRRWKSWGMLAIGLLVGLALGGGMTVGVLLERQTAAGGPALDGLKLKAMASHGSDTFAIATGPIDDEVEGLFTLDFLTGELQCFVVNSRAAAPGGWFKTNIAKDMSIEKGKKPSFLIATGQYTVRGSYGNARPAASLVYIADANTGEVAVYTFPWNKAAASAAAVQASEMRLVAKWKARSLELRE